METYFGKIDPSEFSNVDIEDTFEHNGNHYWYKLVMDNDEFKLMDTCERMIPFCVDIANEFATMGFVVSKFYDVQREAQALIDKRMDQLQQLVQFWETN